MVCQRDHMERHEVGHGRGCGSTHTNGQRDCRSTFAINVNGHSPSDPETARGPSDGRSSTSLLPIVLPARDVRSLPERLPAVVGVRLQRLGVGADLIASELQSMRPVVVAPTVDRSVLGVLVDFGKAVPYYFETHAPGENALAGLEAWLEQTPCHAGLFRIGCVGARL